MIWDLHCHLNEVPGRTPEERMAELIRFADRMGIEKVVVFMCFPFLYDPSPEQLREQNNQVLQALSHWHDRAFGFVYLSPKHVAFSLEEFDRCVRDGPMVGIKLWTAVRCNAPELDPIVERAASLHALINLSAHLAEDRRQPAGRVDAVRSRRAGRKPPPNPDHLRAYRRRLGAGHPGRPLIQECFRRYRRL